MLKRGYPEKSLRGFLVDIYVDLIEVDEGSHLDGSSPSLTAHLLGIALHICSFVPLDLFLQWSVSYLQVRMCLDLVHNFLSHWTRTLFASLVLVDALGQRVKQARAISRHTDHLSLHCFLYWLWTVILALHSLALPCIFMFVSTTFELRTLFRFVVFITLVAFDFYLGSFTFFFVTSFSAFIYWLSSFGFV